jgi:SAM-dependent methyltransferase
MQDQFIYTTGDLLVMLDALVSGEGDGGASWSELFADRSRPLPFLVDWPDENLVAWFGDGLLAPGRVLELGCGNGRNATYLAGLGCQVGAIDFSSWAIERARERATAAGAAVEFQCCSIFDATFAAESCDLVYDSGCFHHLPPHRRQDYVALVHRALKPGGRYGLVCFRPEGGSGLTDHQVYEQATLGGGLGYTEERLRGLWDRPPFSVQVLRQMTKTGGQGPSFGEDFLWALLAAKDGAKDGAA